MAIIVSVECPACAKAFPVDPDKVPLGGARTECTACETPFRVDPDSWGGGGADEHEPWAAAPSEAEEAAAWEEASQSFEGLSVVEDAPEIAAAQETVDEDGEAPAGEATAATESIEEVAGEAAHSAGEGWTDEVSTDGAVDPWDDEAPGPVAEFGVDTEGPTDLPEDDLVELPGAEHIVPESEQPAHDQGPAWGLDPSGHEHAPIESTEESGVEGAATEWVEESTLGEAFGEGTGDVSADPGQSEEPGFETNPFAEMTLDEPAAPEAAVEEMTLDEPSAPEAAFEEMTLDEPAAPEAAFEEMTLDDAVADAGAIPHTGELVTDQWADLVDAGADDAGEVASDWGSDEGDSWVLETEDDLGLAGGGIEVEPIDTVEDQVRAAKDDPDLTAPAEGVDTNQVPDALEGAFGDFMSGQETMLPQDALEVDSPALNLEEDPGAADFGAGSMESGQPVTGFSAAPGSTDAAPVTDEGEEVSTFQFGRRDPHDKARRLARVLVSDMITYNPDRHDQARHNGSVRQDFEDEIQKSWAEYVEQVGPDLAESTDYWRDALNEILAGGEPLF